jgi:hypothetical protein
VEAALTVVRTRGVIEVLTLRRCIHGPAARTLGASIQTIRKDPAVFMFFFLRFKYGPPIIVLAGLALMTIAAGVTHHLATGITGAGLVVIGATAGVTRKRRGIPAGDPDEAPRAISREER